MASHAAVGATGRRPGSLRLTNRKLLAVVSTGVVLALLVALFLQAIPGLGGGGSSASSTSSSVLTGRHHAKNTAFVRGWRSMINGFLTQTRQLQQAGRTQAGNVGAMVDVYRSLEHETNAVIAQASALHPDPQAASTYSQFLTALRSEDRDLRAVVAAGDGNDMKQLQSAISALVGDVAQLSAAHAAVENALSR
jgi:metal-responsive CopG/Arc/MetJ family transcriptional regulator